MNLLPKSGYFCFFKNQEVSNFISREKLDVLILESNREPGYYSKANFPINMRQAHDHHLFILVKNAIPCFQDIVLRKSKEIIRQEGLALQASPGQIYFQNINYLCIRLRVNELLHVPQFIQLLKLEGIKFLKNKKVEPFTTFVQFKKFINIELMSEGVFVDLEQPSRYFVQIPRPIEFEAFERLIEEIKFSCKFNNFDASLAYLNQGEYTFDFVVVYSDHCEKERLKEFKENIDRLMT